MSGHDEPAARSYAGEPLPGKPVGLGARYVAARYSAAFFEARAKSWRRAALLGWALALSLLVALGVVIFG